MHSPYIISDNFILKIADHSNITMICDFYKRNKEHLAPWEPTRKPEFYTENHWIDHINSAQKSFQQKQDIKLIALNINENQMIATCNFSNIIWGCFYACHLGFSIDKSYQGKGIMFEIISEGINYIKTEFKLHRIMANHLPNNHRSENLLNKLGFEKEGYAKSYLKINGNWQDHILNSLILPSE